MKKLLGILVLGLLFCNTVFAKQTALACVKKFNKGNISTHSIIINDDDQTLTFNGDSLHTIVEWNENFISFNPSSKTKFQIEMDMIIEDMLGPQTEYRLDRITGYLNGTYKCEVVTKPKF